MGTAEGGTMELLAVVGGVATVFANLILLAINVKLYTEICKREVLTRR